MDVKEQVLEILNNMDDSIEYEEEDSLIDDMILDSFAIITLVGDLEDTFDIEIGASDMTADNFNTVDAITDMVIRLRG